MTQTATTPDAIDRGLVGGGWGQFYDDRLGPIKRYAVRNPSLIAGLGLMLSLALFVGIGHLVWDTELYRVLSTPTRLAPSF